MPRPLQPLLEVVPLHKGHGDPARLLHHTRRRLQRDQVVTLQRGTQVEVVVEVGLGHGGRAVEAPHPGVHCGHGGDARHDGVDQVEGVAVGGQAAGEGAGEFWN